MTDPNARDPILRSLLLRILDVLDQVPALAQSTQPMAKRAIRDQAALLAVALRRELPGDANDDDARAITLATNDPARGDDGSEV